MAIVVETIDQASLGKQVRLTQRCWLTADKSRVVPDGDPEAAFLYGNEGTLVSEREALELGAISDTKAEAPANKRKKVTTETETE